MLLNPRMSLHKLPPELLLKIFDFIDPLEQLAQCRLVCKTWSNIVESVMFGKHINIKSTETAMNLCYHLSRNPANGKRIKYFEFASTHIKSQAQLKLLPLMFTPNLEWLKGMVYDDSFFLDMIKIACNSSLKFDKLRAIPSYYHCPEAYNLALVTFKETIHEMSMAIFPGDKVIDCLDEFKYLTFLKLNILFGGIQKLNLVLSKCHYLQELQLVMFTLSRDTAVKTTEQFYLWAEDNVVKANTLNKLKLLGDPDINVIEFLAFKYPKIEKALICTIYSQGFEEIILTYPARIVNAFIRSSIYELNINTSLDDGYFEISLEKFQD